MKNADWLDVAAPDVTRSGTGWQRPNNQELRISVRGSVYTLSAITMTGMNFRV
jgi:hypothetical protein